MALPRSQTQPLSRQSLGDPREGATQTGCCPCRSDRGHTRLYLMHASAQARASQQLGRCSLYNNRAILQVVQNVPKPPFVAVDVHAVVAVGHHILVLAYRMWFVCVLGGWGVRQLLSPCQRHTTNTDQQPGS
jgi:hypothetical protein